MIVGLPKEIKDNEYRVGLVPAGVRALTDAGHKIVVERGAGEDRLEDDCTIARRGAGGYGMRCGAGEILSKSKSVAPNRGHARMQLLSPTCTSRPI